MLAITNAVLVMRDHLIPEATILLEDGVIAGSVLTLNKAVKNLFDHTSLTLPQAIACASLNPAAAIGEDHRIGSLEVGKQADIILCDENLQVFKTVIEGKEV